MKMTAFVPSPEQLEAAKKLARGGWQEYLIDYGYDHIRGEAVRWSENYRRSLLNFCKRLNEAGIEAKAFIPYQCKYYLILGGDWICLCERVEAVLSAASYAYASLRDSSLSKETKREIRKVRLRWKLRSLIKQCKSALIYIGYNYKLALRRHQEPKAAYAEAVRLVETVERLWDEMKGCVGIFLL
jgi:hypothetical protein